MLCQLVEMKNTKGYFRVKMRSELILLSCTSCKSYPVNHQGEFFHYKCEEVKSRKPNSPKSH